MLWHQHIATCASWSNMWKTIAQSIIHTTIYGAEHYTHDYIWRRALYTRPYMAQSIIHTSIYGAEHYTHDHIWRRAVYTRPYMARSSIHTAMYGTEHYTHRYVWHGAMTVHRRAWSNECQASGQEQLPKCLCQFLRQGQVIR